MSKTSRFRSTFRICWSWLSPPGVLIARNGLPSFKMIVGVSVVLGRLPPTRTFGLTGSRSKTCMRFDNGTPVSPAMNAPPTSHPELGVALNRLPSLSPVSTHVESPDVSDHLAPRECGKYRAAAALPHAYRGNE